MTQVSFLSLSTTNQLPVWLSMMLCKLLIPFFFCLLERISFTYNYIRPFRELSTASPAAQFAEPNDQHRAMGTCCSAGLQEGLLLTAALCYCFVPSYGPHQSATTAICARSSHITADKASWEVQMNSFSKLVWFCLQEVWECSGVLLCWQRTGLGRDRSGQGQTLGPLCFAGRGQGWEGMDRDRHWHYAAPLAEDRDGEG